MSNLFINPESEGAVLAYLMQHGGEQLGTKVEEGFNNLIATSEGKEVLRIITVGGIIGESALEHLTKTAETIGSLERLQPIIASIVQNIAKMSDPVLEQELEKLRGCHRRRVSSEVGKALESGSMDASAAIKSLGAVAVSKNNTLIDAFSRSALPFPNLKSVGIPPRREIIGDWFKEQDLGFIYAPRGIGKTWLSLGLISAVAGKESFGPWRVHDRPQVLYVDGEMPVEDIHQRLESIGGVDDSVRVLNHETLFHHERKVLNLTDKEAQDALTRLCLRDGIGILVLDNLSSLFRGVSENDADAWEAVLPWLLDLRRHRVAVVIVAHAGRNGQMRGTSRREDHAFWVIKLEETPCSGLPRDGARFICRFTKDRNSKRDQPVTEWTFATGDDGKTSVTTKEADGLAVLVEWVKDGLTAATDIGKEMGLSTGQVSKMAKRAIEAGRLKKEGRGYAIP